MKYLFLLLATVGFQFALANAPSVVTTTTDLAWVAGELLGSPKNQVRSLLSGTENPHFMDASPNFIRWTADADVVCLVGLDLEVGWLPKVLSRSGNSKVQPGGSGYCNVGKAIQPLEVPEGPIDRSMGDVHPLGNPHFWLSPSALAEGATAVAEALAAADPKSAALYQSRLKALQARLKTLQDSNKKRIDALKQKPLVIEYHKEFTYFLSAYGLKSFGSIEEKPGVPPSAGRIAEIAQRAKAAGVTLVLAAEYSPKKTLERFEELSGIPVLTVPTSLSKDEMDYDAYQNGLVEKIVNLAGKRVATSDK
ncbi:MAG: metal ABC transporter substrate-binding protein [Bdellovibrionota bacterium]